MTEVSQPISTTSWAPNALDRCDSMSCPAQAYVRATGVSGELFFCGHHYEAIVTSETSLEKLKQFAFEIVDCTDSLIENRLQGDN